MKLTWLGHAAFLITSERGKRILTDPYESGSYDGALAYRSIDEEADVVTVSHQHADHYHPQGLKGHPEIVTGAGIQTGGSFTFKGIASFHDPSGGTERGENTILLSRGLTGTAKIIKYILRRQQDFSIKISLFLKRSLTRSSLGLPQGFVKIAKQI